MFRIFSTFDLSGPYYNSTFYLPSQDNFRYLEFYITRDTTTSGKQAKEVWYEIEDQISTLKSSNPGLIDFYSGSLTQVPSMWSPLTDLYLSFLNSTTVKFKGAAVAQDATKLYYIAIPIVRAEYNMNNTIASRRIRYLVGYFFLKLIHFNVRPQLTQLVQR